MQIFFFFFFKFSGPIVNTNSCTRCTVRPNKLKCWGLEQRKVYCKTMQGDELVLALKSLELPEGFW